MKKKSIWILLSVLLIAASIFMFVACNKTDDVDKSFQNVDFVGYRKKIVTILKDNGIFVNDIDAMQRTMSYSGNANFKLASVTNHANAFDEIMAKPEYLANSDDYEASHNVVFEMSLKMSLCLGDGISNYFGETKFFDIPVQLGNSYISVSEDGNINTVRSYSPDLDGSSDMFENIQIEFNTATDYYFTSLSILGGSSMFASGNAQKQFIMILIDDNYGEVIYSPNGTAFYATTKVEVLNECLDIIGSDAFDIDKTKFYENKTNARYAFTDEQVQALSDKYFKEIQSNISTATGQGAYIITKGGISFADSYLETENHDTAIIPEGTEYINKDFVIQDESNTVTKLYIPKSVKGIVRTHNEQTGEELATPQTVSVNELIIELYGNKNGQLLPKPLKSITVENGSPLFSSGSGHLRTADGLYIYFVDAPVPVFDYSLFGEYASYLLERYEEFEYTNLYFDVTELNANINSGVDLTSPLLKKLTTINVGGTYDENNPQMGLILNAFNDITVNVDIADSFRFHGIPVNFSFESADGRSHSVTVNLSGLTVIDEVYANGVSVTVNMGMPKIIYEISGIAAPNIYDGVRYVYVPTSLTEEQAENFAFEIHTRSGQMELEVTPNSEKETLVMPEEAGFDITAISIEYLYWTKEIILNSKVKYVIAQGKVKDDAFLIYDGTVAEFEQNVKILCYGESYTFNVRFTNGTKTYSGTTTIPEDELCYVTLNVYDTAGKLITKTVPAAKGKTFNYAWCIDINENLYDCTYLALSGNNTIARVSYTDSMMVSSDPENVFICHYALISYNTKLTGDESFTLVQYDEFNEPEQVTLSQNGFECNINIFWSSSVVNLLSATYNGAELYLSSNSSFTMPDKFAYYFYNDEMMLTVVADYKLIVENGKLTFKVISFEITAVQNGKF